MRDVIPAMPTGFARRLLAYEAALERDPGASGPVAFRVSEKLRGPLGKLLGVDGFRSLLVRARALAAAEVPWLVELEIKVDGSWGDLDGLEEKLDAGILGQGEVFLVGPFLGLLVTFIGPAVTLRVVHDIWPKWE